MNTRAKLVCVAIEPQEADGLKTGEKVSFQTQYNSSDGHEDNTFSLFTPSATFEMFVSNPDVYGGFKPSKAYYFDISEA